MTYKIPLFNLHFSKEEEKAIIETLRSKWISMGPNVKNLEDEFAKHFNVKNTVAVTNCTAALHLALKILEVKKDDEVLIPSLTFVATANAVKYVQAIPVFTDIASYEDFSIDPNDIKKKITPKTKAIIVMHYGGFACEMDNIIRIAKEHDLFIIEDAAHSPSSEYKGRRLGTLGDIGCFSFFSNKNITCAEGGMLITNNDEYAQKAKFLRSHGMTSLSYERAKGHAADYDVIELGYNYRMDDIRGALALSQFKKLKADVERREKLRKCYLEELSEINDIIIPYEHFFYKSSNYIFPILLKNSDVKKRNKIRGKMAEEGIQTSVHYPAVHKFSVYQKYKLNLPKTEYVADNEITLPLFYTLTKKEIKYVSKTLKKIL